MGRNKLRRAKRSQTKRARKRNQKPQRNRGRWESRNARAPVAQTEIIRNKGVLRELRIAHREFVTDIVQPESAGIVSVYQVNPGLESFFPWLSQIAQRFESFYFHSLKIHYVPAVSTATSGTIALIPDYDSADDNSASSKGELLSFEDSVRGAWWSSFTMKSTPRNLRKIKTQYVRGAPLAANLDIKMYDPLQLIIHASSDAAMADKVGGELWVEYDIQLITPQMKHNSEALRTKAAEWITTAQSVVGDKNVISEFVSNGMNANVVRPFTDPDYDAVGITTPGVYGFDINTDETRTYGTQVFNIGVDYSDVSRDCFYNPISTFSNTGATKISGAGIFEVDEESVYPLSPAMIWNTTDTASLTSDALGTMHELIHSSSWRSLPKSDERIAYARTKSARCKMRAEGKYRGWKAYKLANEMYFDSVGARLKPGKAEDAIETTMTQGDSLGVQTKARGSELNKTAGSRADAYLSRVPSDELDPYEILGQVQKLLTK